MTAKGWIAVIVILALLIAALAWLDLTTPAKTPAPNATEATTTASAQSGSSAPTASSSAPLDKQVTVTKPTKGASVQSTFAIAGTAPSGWYSEAVFPVQVRDSDDDLIGSSQGRAQSDWTQPGPIPFTSQVTLDTPYHGAATLILLKDNPSGDPENSDEVTVPIVIQ